MDAHAFFFVWIFNWPPVAHLCFSLRSLPRPRVVTSRLIIIKHMRFRVTPSTRCSSASESWLCQRIEALQSIRTIVWGTIENQNCIEQRVSSDQELVLKEKGWNRILHHQAQGSILFSVTWNQILRWLSQGLNWVVWINLYDLDSVTAIFRFLDFSIFFNLGWVGSNRFEV